MNEDTYSQVRGVGRLLRLRGGFQACILADAPGIRFALDFGATSLVALRRQRIEHDTIDAIVLSHFHGDHCGGVPFLLMDALLASKRTRPLTIAGPPEVRARMEGLRVTGLGSWPDRVTPESVLPESVLDGER